MPKPRPCAAAEAVLDSLPSGAGSPALVAVSGGRDSVALLHGLVERGAKGLIVCHLDHALRPESAADAAFVNQLAGELGLEFASERVDVAAQSRKEGVSVETAARAARHAFFARVARSHACPRVYLAHHADDRVETFLFNLCRGAGTTGLRSMAADTVLDGMALTLLRPLLGVWREEIDAFIADRRLEFREDASNATLVHTRNRLRHEAIPALSAAMDRDVRRALWRAAEVLQGEDEWMRGQTPALGRGEQLLVKDLTVHPVALQRRLLHAWLRAHAVGDVGFVDVENVRRLVTDLRPAKVNLSGGQHVRRQAGRIWLE